MKKFNLTRTIHDNGESTYHINDQEIIFKKLTLITGDNGSGKTGIMWDYLVHHEYSCLEKYLSNYEDVFEEKVSWLQEGINKPVVGIEQPEIELSERNQFLIGQEIVSYIAKGHQILLETHSSHILNAVRLAVKNNVIDASDVNIIYLGEKIINISIFPKGKIDSWPDGFFDVEFDAMNQLIVW